MAQRGPSLRLNALEPKELRQQSVLPMKGSGSVATEDCAPARKTSASKSVPFLVRRLPALDVTLRGPSDPTPTCPRPLPCASSDPEPL